MHSRHHVHVPHSLPVCGCCFHTAGDGDTGVGAEDVDSTAVGEYQFDQLLQLDFAADITVAGQSDWSEGFGELSGGGFVAVGNDNTGGTRRCQSAAECCANSTSCSRDHYDPACHVHAVFRFCRELFVGCVGLFEVPRVDRQVSEGRAETDALKPVGLLMWSIPERQEFNRGSLLRHYCGGKSRGIMNALRCVDPGNRQCSGNPGGFGRNCE
jgi:hypothetical protein